MPKCTESLRSLRALEFYSGIGGLWLYKEHVVTWDLRCEFFIVYMKIPIALPEVCGSGHGVI